MSLAELVLFGLFIVLLVLVILLRLAVGNALECMETHLRIHELQDHRIDLVHEKLAHHYSEDHSTLRKIMEMKNHG